MENLNFKLCNLTCQRRSLLNKGMHENTKGIYSQSEFEMHQQHFLCGGHIGYLDSHSMQEAKQTKRKESISF